MKLAQLHGVLDKVKGATFASMDTITEVKLKGGKKNPMLGRVTKRTSNNQVMVFTNSNENGYENMVKRRLEAEGKNPESFKLGDLPWGKRIPNTPIIENKDKYYMQVIFQKPGKSEYFLDNKPIDPKDIEGLEIKKVSGEGQGLSDDNAVVVRTFALDSIDSIRIMGEEIN